MHSTPARVRLALPILLIALADGAGLIAGSTVASAHQGPHTTISASDAAADAGAISRSIVQVRLPSVPVRQHNGKHSTFDAVLDNSRSVLLNFVFTTCTGICLPMSQVFSATQERLGSGSVQVQMISISVDPSLDTPTRLAEYAGRFGAGPQWSFHTGSQGAIDTIQRAFNVYRPDKMGHTPVTFVRPLGSRQWVRLDGFASPDRLIREAQGQVLAASSP